MTKYTLRDNGSQLALNGKGNYGIGGQTRYFLFNFFNGKYFFPFIAFIFLQHYKKPICISYHFRVVLHLTKFKHAQRIQEKF